MRLKGEPCYVGWCVALVEQDGDAGCKVHEPEMNSSYVPTKLSMNPATKSPVAPRVLTDDGDV